MFWKKYGKPFVLPAVGIIAVGAGAVGGAYGIDRLGAKYLWAEPENLVVIHATPQRAPTTNEFSEDATPLATRPTTPFN